MGIRIFVGSFDVGLTPPARFVPVTRMTRGELGGRYAVVTRIVTVTASAVLETVTGVALIADPAFVIQLLFGAQLSGGGVAVGRVCGIGLLALGLACLPSRNSE